MLTSLSGALIAGALLAGSANAGDHFIQTQNRQLSYTRIDPLRTPGTVGPHVHNVVGASNFSPDSTTPEILQQSKCSSTMVQDDKSIYWTPLVYYNHGNGSYSPIVSSTRIYYFLKPGNGTQPVKAFPKGFRMLAGGYNDRRPDTYPPRGELSYDQLQAMDPRIAAIKWGCSAGAVQGEGNGGSLPGQRPYLPNDAPNGCGVLNAGLFFPSCGDGRLDSDDHFSHMAYPLDESNGYNCPPAIRSSTRRSSWSKHFYFPSADQPYRGANQNNWILSNGDATGLNMHGDFINGWNQDTLEQTMQQCNTPNAPEADLQACAPLAKSIDVEAANTCLSEGNIADEDVGLLAPITGFPGCNPYWPAESPTKPVCVASSNVGLVQPSSRLTVDEFKMNLPIANGTSKTITGPSVGNMTDDYNYNYGPSSSYAATATSSYADTTTTTTTTTPPPPRRPTDVTSTGSSATGTASGSEAVPTEIASTITASTEDPASTGAALTGSQATSAAGVSSTESGLANEASATATDSSILGALLGSRPLLYPLHPEHPVVTPGNQGSVAPNEPTLSATSTDQSVPTSASSPDSSAATSVSSTTSPANAVPTSQNANTLNPGNNSGRPKTCRRKSNRARSHARRRRAHQNRLSK
ncbi:hypothetical protein RHS01_04662 [Rhizoctonia solani]|uniref:DUF1996 domain-containing protein n=1 Tax=Rhizoctonia solani TaxID=456999 RepID=A0A8H7IEM0_9AGAM|nr:hypothetical protein RHS01_04662 [Rhizoctonia solani]